MGAVVIVVKPFNVVGTIILGAPVGSQRFWCCCLGDGSVGYDLHVHRPGNGGSSDTQR